MVVKTEPGTTTQARKRKAPAAAEVGIDEEVEVLELEDGQESYVVEKILGERRRRGKAEFRISWQGFDASHNSWEPEENVLDRTLVEAWRARRRGGAVEPGSGQQQLPTHAEELACTWVQCERCEKWRRLQMAEEDLPEEWRCELNEDVSVAALEPRAW